MQKVAIVRRENKPIDDWKDLIEKYGFKLDKKSPDLVLSVGGDGTFLISERLYPGIPKVLIKESKICIKCHDSPAEHILEKIKNKQFKIEEFQKLEVSFKDKILKAANDIIIRNKLPINAIRFEISNINEELIGDGIVAATSFGSTGYFHSITKKSFDYGFGLAFNNTTKHIEPLLLKNISKTFKITRGEALVSADNNDKIFEIKEGDEINIYSSKEKARIVKLL